MFWIGSKTKSKWNPPLLCWRLFCLCYLAAHRGIGIGVRIQKHIIIYMSNEAGPYEWEYLSLRFNVEPPYFLISKLSSYITGFPR